MHALAPFAAGAPQPVNLERVDPNAPDGAVVAAAAERLRAGGLVAFPTETVYGLGAHALDAAAVRRIFAAKGRPAHNPLIVHVPDVEGARALVTAWPDAAARLAAAFWPGPLTLVLPKRPGVPDEVTAGLGTVAVRVPAHPVALALLRAAALPVAAPSANPYTRVSPTTAEHVARGLGERVDLILDGGPTQVGIESAVVDLSGPRPTLLRPGALERAALEAVVGPLARASEARAGVPRSSPGMDARHYAPGGTLRRFAPDQRPQAAAEARAAMAAGARVGTLVLEPLELEGVEERRLAAEPGGYARGLYAALHELEEAGCALILVEDVPEGEAWAGVRDRLGRAAG